MNPEYQMNSPTLGQSMEQEAAEEEIIVEER
jgi:hypothetical protein